jgi:hypothetical protein
MAKIATYPIASPVAPDDMVIGTSTASEFPLQTKNFRVSDINALGSTPIPVASFRNTTGTFSIPAGVSPSVNNWNRLQFNETYIEDDTGDIQKISNTKIKLTSGGIYSFELRYNAYLLENGEPFIDNVDIRVPVALSDVRISGWDCYNPLIKISTNYTFDFQFSTNNYYSWTKVFFPGQEVELGMFLFLEFEIPGGPLDYSFRFVNNGVTEDDLSPIPGLEVVVKRFRQLTVEEYLKYAEAVGLTSSAVVP